MILGYGYCSLDNSGGRYKRSITLSHNNFIRMRRRLRKRENVKAYAVNISSNVWKLYMETKSVRNSEVQPLACHGASILAISKIILMTGIHFLLSHLRPDKAQLLYLDTDSMHFSLNDPIFENNIASHMRESFEKKKYFYLDPNSAPSGMLVVESIVDFEQIFAEKFYILKMKDKSNSYCIDSKIKCIACKGIPQKILNKYYDDVEHLTPAFGYQESAICRMGTNMGITNSVRYKVLGGLILPSRRFFADSYNSTPFLFPDNNKISYNNEIEDYRYYLYASDFKKSESREKRKLTISDIAENKYNIKKRNFTLKEIMSKIAKRIKIIIVQKN